MDYVEVEATTPTKSTNTNPVQGASRLDVPVINMNESDVMLVRSVMEACRDWGAFIIVNHNIPSDIIKKVQDVGKAFFELSDQDEKEKYARQADSKSIEGYETMMHSKVTPMWVEYLYHKVWHLSARNFQFWPQNPPTYWEVNEEYSMNLQGVVNKLLKILSMGLGLKDHELKHALGGEELVHLLKINHYPPCPTPDLVHGITPHTDLGAITILFSNDVQGLQLSRDGDDWYDVECTSNNGLVVLIGDQLEIVSNGKCKPGLHRSTVNKEQTRYSWPVFIEPPMHLKIGPHPLLVTQENPAKYYTKTYEEYIPQKEYTFPYGRNASKII